VSDQPAYDVYSRNCPARLFFDRLAERWVLLIIHLLRQGGAQRFSEIKRRVNGISQKVLSQKLKQLERDGLIARTVYPEVPVRVEYRLTPLGGSFAETIDQVGLWAEQNVEQMQLAQAQYDAQTPVQAGEPGLHFIRRDLAPQT